MAPLPNRIYEEHIEHTTVEFYENGNGKYLSVEPHIMRNIERHVKCTYMVNDGADSVLKREVVLLRSKIKHAAHWSCTDGSAIVAQFMGRSKKKIWSFYF